MTSSDSTVSKPADGSLQKVGDTIILLLMFAFLVLPAFLSVSPTAPETVTFFGWETPSTCFSTTWLGLECVTCGLTRSFSLVTHGEMAAAFSLHPLGPILYLVMALEAIYRLAALFYGHQHFSSRIKKIHMMLWAGMIAAMFIAWPVRLLFL